MTAHHVFDREQHWMIGRQLLEKFLLDSFRTARGSEFTAGVNMHFGVNTDW